MKKNRMKFLIIEFLLLLLAVFFVWKIFDQNVAEPRIAVILPESGDKTLGCPDQGNEAGCGREQRSYDHLQYGRDRRAGGGKRIYQGTEGQRY